MCPDHAHETAQTTKARLGILIRTHIYQGKVSFTNRKEMEVREMQKTAVNITLVELGKLKTRQTMGKELPEKGEDIENCG